MEYQSFDLEPHSIKDAIKRIESLGFLGINVTTPYKEMVVGLIDEIETCAKLTGAINTIKLQNNKLVGYNTDGTGFIKSLKRQNINIKGKKVLIIGAGGASRSISVNIALENPSSIHIYNRTRKKAIDIVNLINDNFSSSKACIDNNLQTDGVDVIVNTTSLGMMPNKDVNPIEGQHLNRNTIVCDIVYSPLNTAMLQYASNFGCRTINGIGMLIGQALESIEIWIDYKLPDFSWDIMEQAAIN